ncbi:hypothetical protein DFS34DRAFT_611769 [Phlyctochytrium arcticum]|nr:hypothetical protein DFS34DRAFT_611769 [Phlyctochytrium arcticum]
MVNRIPSPVIDTKYLSSLVMPDGPLDLDLHVVSARTGGGGMRAGDDVDAVISSPLSYADGGVVDHDAAKTNERRRNSGSEKDAVTETKLADVGPDGNGKKVVVETAAPRFPTPVKPPRWTGGHQILAHAVRGGLRSFLLGWALRGGITFLLKLIRVVKGKLPLRLALKSFFSAEPRRMGLMIGYFSFTWKLINNSLFYLRGNRQSKLNGFIAGSVAGLGILFQEKSAREGVAQQLFVRSMQAGYNALKAREVIHLPYGDSALFMVACGSILYAYAMQPETIPPEYYSWMLKTARVPKPILTLNRHNLRAWEASTELARPLADIPTIKNALLRNREGCHPSSLPKAMSYIAKHAGTAPMIPCSVLHPGDPSCVSYNSKLIFKVMAGIAPVYAALNFVPMLALKTGKFVKAPKELTIRGVKSTFRSSLFLGVFVLIYMSGICTQRNLARTPLATAFPSLTRDHKLIYYFLGVLCSSSILIEHKSRRSELAMYVLPKGLQSLWMVLHQRGKMPKIPGFSVYMNCVAMGILMSVYQMEPERMSTLMFKVMEKLIGRN